MKSIKFVVILVLFVVCAFVIKTYYLTYDSSDESASLGKNFVVKGKLLKTMALLADSHIDYERLSKALNKAKTNKATLLVHFGDLSDFGGINELSKTKQLLDNSGIDYFVLPGDRDVVEEGKNFKSLFSSSVCTTQMLTDYKILCLSNPYNYTLIDEDYISEFYKNLPDAEILFVSQPIYNPTSNVYMGFYNESVKKQADDIYSKVSALNVKYVFSGDSHFFAKYKSGDISYYNLGAITDKKNLQTPNFTIINIYENTVDVKQVNID